MTTFFSLSLKGLGQVICFLMYLTFALGIVSSYGIQFFFILRDEPYKTCYMDSQVWEWL